MNHEDDGLGRAAQLRLLAEAATNGKDVPIPTDQTTLSIEQARHVIHELQVHQIELRMQNEELQRVQAELDAVRARYFDLYNLAPVGYLIISIEGLVEEVNLTATTLLGLPRAALVHQPINRFVFRDDQDVYYQHRRQLLATGKPHACELRMMRSDGTTFWAQLTATSVEASATGSRPDDLSATVTRVVLNDVSERRRLEDVKAELEAEPDKARPERRADAGH